MATAEEARKRALGRRRRRVSTARLAKLGNDTPAIRHQEHLSGGDRAKGLTQMRL